MACQRLPLRADFLVRADVTEAAAADSVFAPVAVAEVEASASLTGAPAAVAPVGSSGGML